MKLRLHFSWAPCMAFLSMASLCAVAQIPPSITVQPQSQTTDFESDVAFTVSATGTEPLSYQWFKKGASMADYDNVAGSQTPTLYLVGVGQQNALNYWVVVSNAAGSVTSSVATLTVNPRVVLQDGFENGLGQWSPMLDGTPMGIDGSRNHTANGAYSAMITNSAQKMYHRLNPKESARVRLTIWIYDDGGAQTAIGELRAHSGDIGYAKYVPGKGMSQCYAVGMYNSDFGTNPGPGMVVETPDPTRYQGWVKWGKWGIDGCWFNLNGPGAPSRSRGWHQFQIDRQQCGTNIDFYVDGVLARAVTGVTAGSMIDTVTIGSTGLGKSNQWPAVPVSAWFDDVTVEGAEMSGNYQSLASHGPIPDVMQLRETGTDPADVNVSPATVCELSGAATNAGVGAWEATNSELFARGIRGYVEYSLAAPADSAYRIEIEGREKDHQWPQMEMKLDLWLDGEQLGCFNLPYGPSSNGMVHCFTPFIRAGAHTLGIYWDNGHPRCSLALDAIRLQSLTGGATVNGMPAWVAKRLVAQCGMEFAPSASLVSPVCLEGRGAYLSMMALSAGTNYPLSPVTIHHGAGNRWYANVPLSPVSVTRAEASYQNGGLTETNDMVWQICNLLDATNMAIRKGDSLLLSAFPDGATNGTVAIHVEGQPPIQTDASVPVPHQFNTAGTYTVTGAYGPTRASGSIIVKVVDASFEGPCPANLPVKWAWWTYWDCTNLPPGVVVESDPRLNFWIVSRPARAARLTNAPPLGVNGREFNLTTSSTEPRYVVARLGANGPILADTPILGYRFITPPDTSFRLASTRSDGSQVIEATYVLSPLVDHVGLNLDVAAAGLTFDDGTLTRTLRTADFDELGICRVNYIRAPGVEGSACMLLKIQRDTP